MSELSPSSRALRWFPWAAIGLLLAVRLCHEWYGPDIWYHLALGERVVKTFDPQPADSLVLRQSGFVNVYWLFQLLVRGTFGLGGIFTVSALFGFVWFAAFAFWLRTTGAGRAPGWGGWLGLGAVFVCQTRFEPRPEVFSYLFLALQIQWLANWDAAAPVARKSLGGFALVQMLWGNTHGYWVLGPILVGAKCLSGALARPRDAAAWRNSGGLAALTLAATLVSPFGLRNWAGVAALWRFFGEMHHEVAEFFPPTGPLVALWTVKIFWLGWAATFVATLFWLAAAPRREAFPIALAAAGLWLSATSFRNIPLLVFLAAPLAGRTLPHLPSPRRWQRWSTLAAGALALTLTGFALASPAGGSSFGIRLAASASPVGFADYLPADFRGTIFNHPADGGYLAFRFPALRLYGDSRYVDAGPVREYFSALRDPAAFRRLDARVHFDAALLKLTESRAVARALLNDPVWRLGYSDLHRAFFTRPTDAPAAQAAPMAVYRGEDLTDRANAESALQWMALLAEANDPVRFLSVLNEFATAPQIPAPVLETAVRYGLATGRSEILAAARALRPKLWSRRPGDGAVVDRLIGQGR